MPVDKSITFGPRRQFWGQLERRFLTVYGEDLEIGLPGAVQAGLHPYYAQMLRTMAKEVGCPGKLVLHDWVSPDAFIVAMPKAEDKISALAFKVTANGIEPFEPTPEAWRERALRLMQEYARLSDGEVASTKEGDHAADS